MSGTHFSLRWWRYVLICSVSTLIATSAYPVYHNKLTQMPLSINFFWFSLFATLASFIVPETFLRKGEKRFSQRLALDEWWRSISVGRKYVIGAGVTYSLYFLCLLKSLQYDQPGVVITVLMLQQISPIIFSVAAFYWLGHRCEHWWAYGVGTVLIALGVMLYKNELSDLTHSRLFDPIFGLVALVMVLDACMNILRAKHRQQHGVDALHTMRSVQIIAVLFSVGWMAVEHLFAFPNAEELLALIYIGFVPTALASILTNRSIDIIGIPMMSTIRSMRPFFALAFSLVPSAWFLVGTTHLGASHYIGMVFAMVGVLVTVWIAKPREV